MWLQAFDEKEAGEDDKSTEGVVSWSSSFEKLLEDPAGLHTFAVSGTLVIFRFFAFRGVRRQVVVVKESVKKGEPVYAFFGLFSKTSYKKIWAETESCWFMLHKYQGVEGLIWISFNQGYAKKFQNKIALDVLSSFFRKKINGKIIGAIRWTFLSKQ